MSRNDQSSGQNDENLPDFLTKKWVITHCLESRKKAAERWELWGASWEHAGSWPEAMKLGLKELDIFIHHIFFLQDALRHLGALLLLKLAENLGQDQWPRTCCCDVAAKIID